MNYFNITGSDNWGYDECSGSLHDQLFGKFNSEFDGTLTKRKKVKAKKKSRKSSDLDNGTVRDISVAIEKKCCGEVTEPAHDEDSSHKSISKKKVKDISSASTLEIKSSGKHVNKLKLPHSEHALICSTEVVPVKTKSKKNSIGKESSTDLQEAVPVKQLEVSEFHKTSKRKKSKRKNVEETLDTVPSKRKKLEEELGVSNSKGKEAIPVKESEVSEFHKTSKGKRKNIGGTFDTVPNKGEKLEEELGTSNSKRKASGAMKVKHLNPSKLLQVFEKYGTCAEVEVQKGDSPKSRSSLLKENATKCLQAARFRFLNERMYTVTGNEALEYFQNDPDAFGEYHQGFQAQVMKWPVNPIDLIISDLQKKPKSLVIADLGCGDAKIAGVFPKRTVHSFDLVALNESVVCCDISKVPLEKQTVDIAVFCLSLMGVNLADYILEAHRILKVGGILKIAEVESRIDDLNLFIANMEKYGFSLISKDMKHKMFVFMDFHKVQRKLKKRVLPAIEMSPCMYKKR